MALPVPKAPGYAQMLKEGSIRLFGTEEAVLRSIEACLEFANTLKSAYGPRGLNKMVINHLEKLFVTNDAATIIRQMDIQHPAARIIIMASEMQEKEVGDGTNFVIVLAGALLEQAEELIRMGLKPVEVIEGYELAREKILNDMLPTLVCDEVKDFQNVEEVLKGIRASIASKQYGSEELIGSLIAKACIAANAPKTAFNVDNVRVCKILGSGINNSEVVQGMVFKKNIEGNVTKASDAKVVVYTCPIDIGTTETKGTVLIHTAEELKNFSRGEENMLEEQIKSIADTGVKVVVSGGKFGDMALHYLNKYNLMAVRLQSKFDVRRLCRTVGATALPKIVAPKPEDLGYCDQVYIDEIGDTPVVIFKQNSKESKISTVVIRGATESVMDDVERAVDDGVNTYKALTKDGRLVPGAGATEAEIACQVTSLAETLPGMEQYAVAKFADALQSVAIGIASNAGIDSSDLNNLLLAAHQEGKKNAGVNIESETASILDAVEAKIFDTYLSKYWGIKYATSAVCTILQVDEIICAKPAGGPKPKQPAGDWDQD
ncbi:T-complex protein 1 subunit theta-like protein [Dinothrombium tinctorium]|uniref:T-complex protein 1 subunit theta n=1 Tax=Dinothrombium tinctorium TaxID=1965070 RepID=A0A443RQZ6_9ACAR|nr:T-complex protein 1 subunit theta-like protein [Dinothrombium tinctorium]